MATVPKIEANHEINDRTKPPFLRRVRIRGFKSIGFCDVHLQPLTILVGRNAAGKSNFLDALAFLRDTLTFGIAEAVERRNRWSSLVCRTSATQTIAIEVEASFTCGLRERSIEDNYDFSITWLSASGIPLDFTGMRFNATYGLEISTGPHLTPMIKREWLEISDETKQLMGGFEVHNGILQRWQPKPNSSALLSLPSSAEMLSIHRSDFPLLAVVGTQPFFQLGERLRSTGFYNFHPDAMRILQKSSPGRLLEKDGRNLASVIESLHEIDDKSVERVKDYLAIIAEEVESFNVAHYGEYETIRFRLRGNSLDSPLEFDAAGMSDGTLRALATLVAVFQVVQHHGYPGLVGIEEPETALHPAAMRTLMDALDDATQRTQILLTSHSADLLSGRDVSPGQVLVVRSRGGQTRITSVDPANREIILKELYLLDELQRLDKLDLDEADLRRQDQLNRPGGA